MKPIVPKSSSASVKPQQGIQRSMFPVQAQDVYHNDQGSADLSIIVTGVNNKDYAVKTTSDGNGFVPATELFCYELAGDLSIATPDYDLIQMRDGSLAFGSVWEGGVLHIKDMPKVLEILKGTLAVRGLKAFLSRAYALDLFINNVDRHFRNYLFRESRGGYIALAFDYSRAWYAFNPFGFECLDSSQNTGICHTLVVGTGNFDADTSKSTLDEIQRVESKRIEQILTMMPREWMPDKIKQEFVEWWRSGDMKDRVLKLKSGIK